MDFRCDTCEITFECEDETFTGELNCPQCEAILKRAYSDPTQLVPPISQEQPIEQNNGLIPPGQPVQQNGGLVPPSGGSTLSLRQPQEPINNSPIPEEPSNFSVFQNQKTQASETAPQKDGPSVFQNQQSCCKNCGNQLPPDAVLCVQCGTKIDGGGTINGNSTAAVALNHGPQLENGAFIIGLISRLMMGLIIAYTLLFAYGLFKGGGFALVILIILAPTLGYLYSFVIKLTVQIGNCAHWLNSDPKHSLTFSSMYSSAKVLVFIGSGLLLVPITLTMTMIFGRGGDNVFKSIGIYSVIGITILILGSTLQNRSYKYMFEHDYKSKRLKIYKIVEILLLALAIHLIIRLISAQLTGLIVMQLKFVSLTIFMVFILFLGSALMWGAFYAYGAYNSMHAVKVKERSMNPLLPLLYVAGIIFLVPAIVSLLPQNAHKTDLFYDTFSIGWQKYVFFALAILGAPIFEELAFRKYLLPGLVKTYGYWGAIFTSAFAFAVAHGNIPQLFPGMFLGVITAYVYLKSGKIKFCIALHFIYNFGVTVVYEYLKVDPKICWITGLALTITSIAIILTTHKSFDDKRNSEKNSALNLN